MTPVNANANAGLLAVEGLTDHHFVLHLCRKANPALNRGFPVAIIGVSKVC